MLEVLLIAFGAALPVATPPPSAELLEFLAEFPEDEPPPRPDDKNADLSPSTEPRHARPDAPAR
ncbi:MAG TPA: hypothetical protein VLI06_06755 [Solimonas sp.]|nr:hypothetical protein [Solimonas sp.]